MRKKFPKNGALLIEVAFAMGLLMLLMMVIMHSGTSSLRASQLYEQQTQANALLLSAAAEVNSNLKDWLPSRTEMSIRSLEGVAFEVSQSVLTQAGGEIHLSVEVAWSSQIGKKTVSYQIHLSEGDS